MSRSSMCSITAAILPFFVTSSDGQWGDAGNWQNNLLPCDWADADIPFPNITVTVAGPSELDGLWTIDGMLDLQDGTLTMNVGVNGANTMDTRAGEIRIEDPAGLSLTSPASPTALGVPVPLLGPIAGGGSLDIAAGEFELDRQFSLTGPVVVDDGGATLIGNTMNQITMWWDPAANAWQPVSAFQFGAPSGCQGYQFSANSTPTIAQLAGTVLGAIPSQSSTTPTPTPTCTRGPIVFPQVTASPNPAHPGDTVTLDGSGSFARVGAILSYAWTQILGPSVQLAGADSTRATFVAPVVDVPNEIIAAVNQALTGCG